MSSMARREKERKEQFRDEMAESTYPKGELKPSDFIEQVKDLEEIHEAILFVRVSSEKQNRDGNSQRQEDTMIDELPSNIKVVKIIRYQGSAKPSQIENEWEHVFEEATELNVRHVVTMTTSRFVRSEKFNATDPENRNAGPNENELQKLKQAAEKHGVNLVTLANPDLSPKDDMLFISSAIKEHAKKNKVEKPEARYKAKQKQEWFAEVCRLHHQSRWSTRRIALHVSKESGVKIDHATISRWIKESDIE